MRKIALLLGPLTMLLFLSSSGNTTPTGFSYVDCCGGSSYMSAWGEAHSITGDAEDWHTIGAGAMELFDGQPTSNADYQDDQVSPQGNTNVGGDINSWQETSPGVHCAAAVWFRTPHQGGTFWDAKDGPEYCVDDSE